MQILTNITRNYIPDWTVLDAMRELLQNAIDSDPEGYQIGLSPLNVSGSNVYSCTIVTNTELPISALFMGESSKRNDNEAIGTHGEGLKLAMLVLLREGREPDIHSSHYIAPEWDNTQELDVLAFHCQEVSKYVGGTIIEFECTEEEFQQFSSMHLPKDHPFGLLEGRPDELFVGGLKISSMGYKYGYNLKPSEISLERDRRVSDPYRLGEAIARLWIETERWDDIAKGLLSGLDDFDGFNAVEVPEPLLEACVKLADQMENAPVSYIQQSAGYRGTYVPHTFYNVYSRSTNKRIAHRIDQPCDTLAKWFKKNRSYFRKAGAARMQELINESKKWRL